MGMYDTVIIKDVDNVPDGVYQTKGLNCNLSVYEINGRSELFVKDRGVHSDSLKSAKIKNANGYLYFHDGFERYLIILRNSKVAYSKKCCCGDDVYDDKLMIDPNTFILEEEE